MSQFTVALDMDSTIYDLMNPWLDWINKTFDEKRTIKDVTTWNFPMLFKCKERGFDFLDIPDMFLSLKPFPNAIEAVNKVREMGVRQVFVTTVSSVTKDSQKQSAWEKQQVIGRDFPWAKKDVMITSGSKDLVRADMLVDDGPHNIEAFAATGGVTAKIPYPYNVAAPADFVFDDWTLYPGIVKLAREAKTLNAKR